MSRRALAYVNTSELVGRLDRFLQVIPGAEERAMRKTAELVKGVAAQLEPLGETSNLRGSGVVLPTERTSKLIRVGVAFTVRYAAAQEVHEEWVHPRGGQARALRTAFQRHGLSALELVIAEIVREMGL